MNRPREKPLRYQFVQCDSKRSARMFVNWADYYIRVKNGFLCFEGRGNRPLLSYLAEIDTIKAEWE
jgi:hypothetical protein